MYKRFIFLLISISSLVACQATPQGDDLQGRILLWHGWSEEEAAVLDEILASFSEIYPDVTIVSAAVPPAELRQQYRDTAELGLGPDLLIAPNDWVHGLADEGLIEEISSEAVDTDLYLSTAVESLRYQDKVYGLPLSLRPVALYYNADLLADEEMPVQPAATLEELLAQAAAGHRVALNTGFDQAFWGIQAFGGRLFDENGRVVLDQGGFANWLSWLKNAQEAPGMILDRDDETLRTLFLEENATYYTAGPEALATLRETLGETAVGVAPLPAGPNGPAGPLLKTEALLFSHASSSHQKRLALELARFLANAEQNAVLMRETGRVPANRRVRVDANAFPAIAGFAAQARTAVPLTNLPQLEMVRELGDDIYRQVLLGVVDVTEATYEITNRVNESHGFATVELPGAICAQDGRLLLWHSWSDPAATTLVAIASDFEERCPNVGIEIEAFATRVLQRRLAEPAEEEARELPDLVIAPSRWVLALAQEDRIQPITNRIEPELLQRYIPAAQNTLRYENGLYGLPLSLQLQALYYNSSLVTDPPATLADLLVQTSNGQTAALPLGFEEAYWGVGAFGGTLFDEAYHLTLVQTDFAEWLAWLQTAQESAGIILESDTADLQAIFVTEEATYYVGTAAELGAIQAQLDGEQVQVTTLPAGPVGEATPPLHTDAFLFPAAIDEETATLALDFAIYATTAEQQTRLMTQAQRVPANVNVDTAGYPAIAAFLEQAQTAVVWPHVPQITAVLQQGNRVYTAVLAAQEDPIIAACRFQQDVNLANGFTVTATDRPEVCEE